MATKRYIRTVAAHTRMAWHWYAALVLVAGYLLFTRFADPRTAFVSPEVHFADLSAHGLEIVPASCPSAPMTQTRDGLGFHVTPGTDGAVYDRLGYQFCASNSSGNTYFLPSKTTTEIQAFLNYLPTGVSQRSYDTYH